MDRAARRKSCGADVLCAVFGRCYLTHAPGRLEASFPWATHEQRLSIECFGLVTLHARWRAGTALYYIGPPIVTEILRFFFVLYANSEFTYSS